MQPKLQTGVNSVVNILLPGVFICVLHIYLYICIYLFLNLGGPPYKGGAATQGRSRHTRAVPPHKGGAATQGRCRHTGVHPTPPHPTPPIFIQI